MWALGPLGALPRLDIPPVCMRLNCPSYTRWRSSCRCLCCCGPRCGRADVCSRVGRVERVVLRHRGLLLLRRLWGPLPGTSSCTRLVHSGGLLAALLGRRRRRWQLLLLLLQPGALVHQRLLHLMQLLLGV